MITLVLVLRHSIENRFIGRQSVQPIKILSEHMSLTQSAGKWLFDCSSTVYFVFVGKKLEVDTVDHLEKDTVLVAFNSTVPFTVLVLNSLQGLC